MGFHVDRDCAGLPMQRGFRGGMRDRLSDLRGSMQGNDKLEELLREAVTDKDKLARLKSELGKEGSNE